MINNIKNLQKKKSVLFIIVFQFSISLIKILLGELKLDFYMLEL